MNWSFGLLGCQIYFLTDILGMIGSVYSLVFLSLGRCILVTLKKKAYIKFVKKIRYVIILMISIWLTGLIFVLPAFLSIKLDQRFDGSYTCGSNWNEKQTDNFFIVKFVFIFIIPFLIILISSVKLLLFLKNSKKRRCSTAIKYTKTSRTNSKEERVSISLTGKNRVQDKAIKIVLTIVVLFIIQWTPIWIFELILTKNSQYIQLINIMAALFSHSNSVSNPFIYIVLSHKFPIISYLSSCFKCSKNPIVV